MADLTVYCKVSHYSNGNGGVTFTLQSYDPKKQDSADSPFLSYSYDLPFEIWSKFKDNNVKVVVSKAD